MCNLYDVGSGKGHAPKLLEDAIGDVIGDLMKRLGIRKTDLGLMLRQVDETWTAEVPRWGFERPINPCINNARSDKLDGKMWKRAWTEKRRCVIPIDTFYEWSGPKSQKQTHAFQSAEKDDSLWAAGLWEESSAHGLCYTMLTRAADSQVEPIHTRMPALIDPAAAEEFLEADDPRELIEGSKIPLRIFNCLNPLTTNRFAEPADYQPSLF
ncbi:MAG: putative SOS response-associated peptidase YedK [Verrucomicrobiales bacterium]|jgi:putative SOS response-associated peptidase YedK